MYAYSRTCAICGDRYHENDDWVQLESGLVACYPCSILDDGEPESGLDYSQADTYMIEEER